MDEAITGHGHPFADVGGKPSHLSQNTCTVDVQQPVPQPSPSGAGSLPAGHPRSVQHSQPTPGPSQGDPQNVNSPIDEESIEHL
ncbi:hypothetical protein [Breoghania sp.]|uniref:hypothetical protein n=1 Tax=Breoghania sp. TaxID=2065378 RepID=UPI0029CA0906|nr:hypothetical protein [Breoghania sp.]